MAATVAIAAPAWAQPPFEALPAILRLSVDQHPAWRAYKDAMAETRAAGSHAAEQAVLMNGLATPGRLQAMRAQMKAEAADFERQAEATEAFYAALSPEQKRIFDRITQAPVPPAPMHLYPRSGYAGEQPSGPQVLKTPPPGDGLPPPAP